MDNQHTPARPKALGLEPTFFGKVMTFFGFAVLISALGTFVGVKYFLQTFIANPVLMWVLFAVELILIFTSRMWSQKAPMNRVLFGAFAFISGLTLAPLIGVLAASPGGATMLMKALFATALVFVGTAAFGWTTKFDLSGLRGFLFMGLLGMIVISIIGIFLPWSNSFELVFSGGGVLLFSGFVMYDFQKLKNYPQDRYLDAALNLYLDIFNLFLYILRFMMAFANND